MANAQDYLVWRGDLSFSAAPWNEIDGLLIAIFSYLDFHGGNDPRGWTMEEMKRIELLQEGTSPSFPARKQLFETMAESVRFGGCKVHHFLSMTDKHMAMQFSAMCIELPDETTCVVFRGTDNTIVGWREDFNMAFSTRVPAQEAAVVYLNRAAELTDRPLRLVGHSKGGNLAVYAASCAAPELQERIGSIWSYDGPGMNREMSQSEGYLRIRDRIHSFVPQTSIIGMLMDYYEPYTVVHAKASGLSQHEPISWQIYGPRFETLEEVDRTALVVRDTLHDLLKNSDPEQRAAFVDAMFSWVGTTKATKMSDLTGEKLRSMLTMVGNRKEVNPEARKIFNRLLAQAVTLGFGNMIDRVRGRKEEEEGEDAWETMSPEKRQEMLAAKMDEKQEVLPAADGGTQPEQNGGEKDRNDP